MIKDAILDEKREYRYMLERQWGDRNDNFVNFVLLNPSTADETVDDPTIKACIKFAQNLKFDGFYVTNLFAFRTKSPEVLKKSKNPVGSKNNEFIKRYAHKSKLVVVAWGNHGDFLNRDKEVLEILSKIRTPHCLAITKSGSPKHPLYINRNTRPFKYEVGDTSHNSDGQNTRSLRSLSHNKDYAVHSFAPLSHSPTFASGTLSAYYTTGKHRIVLDVVVHISQH